MKSFSIEAIVLLFLLNQVKLKLVREGMQRHPTQVRNTVTEKYLDTKKSISLHKRTQLNVVMNINITESKKENRPKKAYTKPVDSRGRALTKDERKGITYLKSISMFCQGMYILLNPL